MSNCKFIKAWIGKCNKECDGDYCEKHNLVCDSCGKPATHECEETMGLVCGIPLCDDCEHELDEQGTNGFSLRHCKKTEQKHKPWYERK